MLCSDDFGFSIGQQSCLASSKYMFCIQTLHTFYTNIHVFCENEILQRYLTGSHCLSLFHIHLCSFSEWHAYPSYFHLSTLNTICCLINHEDLVDTTHSPNHWTTREFPHVFILLNFYVCLWLIEVECGLALARWRRGQCVYVLSGVVRNLWEKREGNPLSHQWVSTGLMVQKWQKGQWSWRMLL